MTINVNSSALKAVLNASNPNVMFSALQAMNFGDFVRAMPVPRYGVAPAAAAANPYVLAAFQSITLPDDAKAGSLTSVYARAGTAAAGPLTIDDASGGDSFSGTGPITKHVAITPSGDLIFLAADAWTSLDIIYQPMKYVVQELTLPVVTNTLTFPTSLGGVVILMEAEALVGTVTGKKIIDVVGTAPAAGHAALALSKLTVAFQATDAVTSARVKFGVYPTVDLDAVLTAVQSTLLP